jgi:hypothetical protein
MNPPLPTDDDTNALFDRAVNQLGMFDHSRETAEALAREFHRLFQDPVYGAALGIPVRDDDFLHADGPIGLAYRIHYYCHIKGDSKKFLDWRHETEGEFRRQGKERFEKWQRGEL